MDDLHHIAQESELYRLWSAAAGTGATFRCRDGRRIVVIARGRRNDLSGPDFLDAVLLIDGRMRTGAVEMHLRESDWFAHRHQLDDAYRGVILHVIAESAGSPLDLPTLMASELRGDDRITSGESAETFAVEPLPAELLAELSWGRLLRRSTAIIRADECLPISDRLRRAFIGGLFDCLGYSRNREPMGLVARRALEQERELASAPPEELAAAIFSASGLSRERVLSVRQGVIDPSRLNLSPIAEAEHGHPPAWRYDGRGANAPERRLWGAVALLGRLYREGLLETLLREIRSGRFREIERGLMVRSGGETLVGAGRAREIIINGLLPAAIAAGLLARDGELVEGGCRLYRESPSLPSNRIVRNVEVRYLNGASLAGAFWQQGAVEFHQRYLNVDRSRLSFIAEGRGAPAYHPCATGQSAQLSA